MAIKQITNARFCNRIDTSDNWYEKSSILEKGEFGIVISNSIPQYILIGDGTTTASAMIDDTILQYDKQKIYLGKGAQYEFNVTASDEILGGIKVKNAYQDCGLYIDENGFLYNSLANNWDIEKNCFVIEKLYVKNLLTDDTQEQNVFEADQIVLRYNAEQALNETEYAGVEVNNIDGSSSNGFFGIDKDNNFVVRQGPLLYFKTPLLDSTEFNSSGILKYSNEENKWSISNQESLEIINGENMLQYNGTERIEINLTPPTIILNSQELPYDNETKTYTGNFTGGLTQENKELIDQAIADSNAVKEELTNVQKDLENIEITKLSSDTITIQPGTNITVNTTAGQGEYSATINHETITTTQTSTASESIKVGSDKSFTFITGIEIENGHVVSITTSSYKFIN